MYNFTVQSPTEVIYGQNALTELVTRLKQNRITKVLIVFGGHSAIKFGHLAKVTDLLEKNGIATVQAGDNRQASWTEIKRGIQLANDHAVQAVLGLGGSICMDNAKAIAFGAVHADIWDYLRGEKSMVNATYLPIVEIPTYPSGGSEADLAAEIYDLETGEHRTLLGTFPKYAILDPSFSASLTIEQAVRGAMVTFIQESLNYLGNGSEIANGFAKVILTSLLKNARAVQNGNATTETRSNLMWAATLTPQAIMNAGIDNDWTS
ncbi:iron-containing alcohol dehydrogenase [Lapidilactobacillus wuchangensis]|uniref:iron-containing alcohol dehydrogenase n=1 Tax=Lapidilactobacillus wuchangensis TaxID=2486001 RepID=UPI000F77502F|nr:iron-containing alcohol dehydrogenase [Lapidilactobacillus wuchangensis]